MQYHTFGSTGLSVSALGFGAGHIGGGNLSEDQVGTLINRAVDLGVNVIDTARGYGMSEERIGRHLSWRRKDYILVSKCGYGVPGVEDWTPTAMYMGVEIALRLMRTDYIDVMMFHSCPKTTLQRSGLIEALEKCVEDGKVRFIGYSGENEDLAFAIDTGKFSVIETSVNLFDQYSLNTLLPIAQQQNIGVIAKRPLANVPWRFAERPVGQYCEPYWERMKAMNMEALVQQSGLAWETLALRFAAFADGVHTAIAGTGSIQNLHDNVDIVNMGALPKSLVATIRKAYREHDTGWRGQV
jgi:aryl-alcohol dehydrogenase-like predicted oxidoreductase